MRTEDEVRCAQKTRSASNGCGNRRVDSIRSNEKVRRARAIQRRTWREKAAALLATVRGASAEIRRVGGSCLWAAPACLLLVFA
eukprot:6156302-Pleurochrysis_carterae.AAC.1